MTLGQLGFVAIAIGFVLIFLFLAWTALSSALEGDGFGCLMFVIIVVIGVGIGLITYQMFQTPRVLKPEGCYHMTHERQWTGKTYVTVEVYTSFPCPEGA